MKKENCCKERLGAVGGQAVLEGVMMKSKDIVALSVRNTQNEIITEVNEFNSITKKSKILCLPIIRGVVNFVETMALSFKTLNRSVDLLGIEEEETKFEIWLKEKFGKSVAAIASVVGTVLGVFLAVGLFFVLPALITDFVARFTDIIIVKSLVDGLSKIVIF